MSLLARGSDGIDVNTTMRAIESTDGDEDEYEDDFEDTVQSKSAVVTSDIFKSAGKKVRSAKRKEDDIRAAFTNTSFRNIRRLEMRHSRTNKIVVKSTMATRNSLEIGKSDRALDTTDVFSSYPYVSSPISLADEQRSRDRVLSTAKRDKISEHNFVPSSNSRVLKHEEILGSKLGKFRYAEDPFDSDEVSRRRERKEKRENIKFGPFAPSAGATRSVLSQVPKLKGRSRDLIMGLKKMLTEDWRGFRSTVRVHRGSDASKLVIVFDRDSLHQTTHEDALHAYFEVFLKTGTLARKFKLRKCACEWGLRRAQTIRFSFRLPWGDIAPVTAK